MLSRKFSKTYIVYLRKLIHNTIVNAYDSYQPHVSYSHFNKRMGYREWTKDEIAKLIEGAEMFRRRRGIDWKAVARYVGTRTER